MDQEQTNAAADPITGQLQQVVDRLGMLTVSLAQQREEMADRQRQHEALTAELVQRRAQIRQGERDLLRAQGAAGALQQLAQQAQQAQTPEGVHESGQ